MDELVKGCYQCEVIDHNLPAILPMLPLDVIGIIKDMVSYEVNHTVRLRNDNGDLQFFEFQEYVPNWGDGYGTHDCCMTGYIVDKVEYDVHYIMCEHIDE